MSTTASTAHSRPVVSMRPGHPCLRVALVLTLSLVCTAGAWAQIKVGQVSAFTGAAAASVKELTAGANLYIEHTNQKGGVNGQNIEIVSADDQFDPKLTLPLATDLVNKHNPVALFLSRGTPATQALMPFLAERKLPMVAPSTGALLLHEPVHPWVFNVRATYRREAARAIEHLASLGITRIALLQTDDSFGEDAASGAAKGLAQAQLKAVAQVKFPRTEPPIDALVKSVVQSEAQAVMVIGASAVTSGIVKGLRGVGAKTQVVTLSNNASEGFVRQLGEHARGLIVTQVFPNERSVTYALVREAQELAKAKGLDSVSPAMLEGFAAAKVLVEGLRRAGRNPTGTKLKEALETMKAYDLGGLSLSYSATNHSGLDFADLSIIDSAGRFRR